jgi:metallo-beta-lactamase family protein
VQVAATIHTIGGLSAHADQHGLMEWYSAFDNTPPLLLVHGEPEPMQLLSEQLQQKFPQISIRRPKFAEAIEV